MKDKYMNIKEKVVFLLIIKIPMIYVLPKINSYFKICGHCLFYCEIFKMIKMCKYNLKIYGAICYM